MHQPLCQGHRLMTSWVSISWSKMVRFASRLCSRWPLNLRLERATLKCFFLFNLSLEHLSLMNLSGFRLSKFLPPLFFGEFFAYCNLVIIYLRLEGAFLFEFALGFKNKLLCLVDCGLYPLSLLQVSVHCVSHILGRPLAWCSLSNWLCSLRTSEVCRSEVILWFLSQESCSCSSSSAFLHKLLILWFIIEVMSWTLTVAPLLLSPSIHLLVSLAQWRICNTLLHVFHIRWEPTCTRIFHVLSGYWALVWVVWPWLSPFRLRYLTKMINYELRLLIIILRSYLPTSAQNWLLSDLLLNLKLSVLNCISVLLIVNYCSASSLNTVACLRVVGLI